MLRMALHWQILLAMLLGAALGVVLNTTAGRQSAGQTVEYPAGAMQSLGMSQPVVVRQGKIWSLDTPERVFIQIEEWGGEGEGEGEGDDGGEGASETRRFVVGERLLVERQRGEVGEPWPPGDGEIRRTVMATLGKLKSQDPAAYALFQKHGRSLARTIGDGAKTLGDLFLRMLKMVSIPLIITSLLSGVTGLGHAERLGKMFGRTLLYYLATSLLAIVTGLLMVNLIRPGVTGAEPLVAVAAEGVHQAGKGLGVVLFEQLENMIPPNPFEAIATGNFLSIIAFSLAFGVCTILVGGTTAKRINELVDAAFQVMMKLTMLIIRIAPLGVFFLMLSATASQGAGVFGTLGWYMLAVACALAIHALIVLPAILHFVAKQNPLRFAQAMSPALLTAFSSASSNGTLPLTLTCVEERAKISNRVGSFVLPLGATINMDGTALYEVVAVLFIAQLSGIELPLSQQIVVAFTALLASIGAAGIPHAGLVMMVIILQAVGLPTESQGLIIAVDRVLDMCRTSVNVWSDSCGCAVVSRFEAERSELAPEPAVS
ncbi:MAG: dicarboxylate/amino acid:cation symporter [Planctomycetes bacterium]|nr:dicarboxylate/amino acid:cation symporter [Planctomycetota bacterium]